jgi:hypothetical protein
MKEYRREEGEASVVFWRSKITFNNYLLFFCDFYHLSSIYSDELVIFLFSVQKMWMHVRFCVDAATPLTTEYVMRYFF